MHIYPYSILTIGLAFLLFQCAQIEYSELEADQLSEPKIVLNAMITPSDSIVYINLHQSKDIYNLKTRNPAERLIEGFQSNIELQKSFCQKKLYLEEHYHNDIFTIQYYENCYCPTILTEEPESIKTKDCIDEYSLYALPHAQATLWGDGILLGEFTHLENGLYQLNLPHTLSNYKTISVKASSEGLTDITASATFPTIRPLQEHSAFYNPDDQKVYFTLKWGTTPFEDNYFALGSDLRWDYKKEQNKFTATADMGGALINEDPIYGKGKNQLPDLSGKKPPKDRIYVFEDQWKGQELEQIRCSLDPDFLLKRGLNPSYFSTVDSIQFILSFYTIGKDIYLNQKDYYMLFDEEDGQKEQLLKEPVQLHSNVQNGLGVLGVYHRERIYYDLVKVWSESF